MNSDEINQIQHHIDMWQLDDALEKIKQLEADERYVDHDKLIIDLMKGKILSKQNNTEGVILCLLK